MRKKNRTPFELVEGLNLSTYEWLSSMEKVGRLLYERDQGAWRNYERVRLRAFNWFLHLQYECDIDFLNPIAESLMHLGAEIKNAIRIAFAKADQILDRKIFLSAFE